MYTYIILVHALHTRNIPKYLYKYRYVHPVSLSIGLLHTHNVTSTFVRPKFLSEQTRNTLLRTEEGDPCKQMRRVMED
jgi:hypothetical protein